MSFTDEATPGEDGRWCPSLSPVLCCLLDRSGVWMDVQCPWTSRSVKCVTLLKPYEPLNPRPKSLDPKEGDRLRLPS